MPKRRRIKDRTVSRMTELAIAAPQVVAIRTGRMLAAGNHPSARDRAEILRMHTEKALAFWECTFALTAQLVKMSQDYTRNASLQLWRAWTTPWWIGGRTAMFAAGALVASGPGRTQGGRAMAKLVDAGVGPWHKRATANARRLARSAHR